MPSTLKTVIEIPAIGEEVTIEESGSIEDLSEKYGFEIQDGPVWDFTGLTGKEVRVRETDKGFKFISYVEED